MAENITIDSQLSKSEKYRALLPQIDALISPEPSLIANLANISAALKETFGFFWVGFYFLEKEELVLGPFQGPVACTRFSKAKGVCGAAIMNAKTIIVPDVEQFPGHIACSALSRSEIVIPFFENGKIILVLDVDSDKLNDFDSVDQAGLEAILSVLSKKNPQ